MQSKFHLNARADGTAHLGVTVLFVQLTRGVQPQHVGWQPVFLVEHVVSIEGELGIFVDVPKAAHVYQAIAWGFGGVLIGSGVFGFGAAQGSIGVCTPCFIGIGQA